VSRSFALNGRNLQRAVHHLQFVIDAIAPFQESVRWQSRYFARQRRGEELPRQNSLNKSPSKLTAFPIHTVGHSWFLDAMLRWLISGQPDGMALRCIFHGRGQFKVHIYPFLVSGNLVLGIEFTF
jgi:hypothetical protein